MINVKINKNVLRVNALMLVLLWSVVDLDMLVYMEVVCLNEKNVQAVHNVEHKKNVVNLELVLINAVELVALMEAHVSRAVAKLLIVLGQANLVFKHQ